MKKIGTFILIVLMFSTSAFSRGRSRGSHSKSYTHSSRSSHSGESVRVREYTKRNGTRVQSHHRTHPDHTKSNNWSIKGNVNPYTGKEGTKNP